MKSNYLIVGAGIFGATVAERLASAGKKVSVIDSRDHIAGNIYSYTDKETGIYIDDCKKLKEKVYSGYSGLAAYEVKK